jgi:hypothetical protein
MPQSVIIDIELTFNAGGPHDAEGFVREWLDAQSAQRFGTLFCDEIVELGHNPDTQVMQRPYGF